MKRTLSAIMAFALGICSTPGVSTPVAESDARSANLYYSMTMDEDGNWKEVPEYKPFKQSEENQDEAQHQKEHDQRAVLHSRRCRPVLHTFRQRGDHQRSRKEEEGQRRGAVYRKAADHRRERPECRRTAGVSDIAETAVIPRKRDEQEENTADDERKHPRIEISPLRDKVGGLAPSLQDAVVDSKRQGEH